jgi:hypothetical protein
MLLLLGMFDDVFAIDQSIDKKSQTSNEREGRSASQSRQRLRGSTSNIVYRSLNGSLHLLYVRKRDRHSYVVCSSLPGIRSIRKPHHNENGNQKSNQSILQKQLTGKSRPNASLWMSAPQIRAPLASFSLLPNRPAHPVMAHDDIVVYPIS